MWLFWFHLGPSKKNWIFEMLMVVLLVELETGHEVENEGCSQINYFGKTKMGRTIQIQCVRPTL